MLLDDVELSELLAVKFCHDLAGPVGAVNNGIELLKDGGDSVYEQAVDLAEMSAKNAVSRVLFYRQAYGTINHQAPANIESLKENSINFFHDSKVEIDWSDELDSSQNISSDMGKIILNSILLLNSAMIYGGKISVAMQNKSILLKAEGKNLDLNQDLVMMLEGKLDKNCKIDVKNVQGYYVYRLLQKMKLKASLELRNDKIEMTIK